MVTYRSGNNNNKNNKFNKPIKKSPHINNKPIQQIIKIEDEKEKPIEIKKVNGKTIEIYRFKLWQIKKRKF